MKNKRTLILSIFTIVFFCLSGYLIKYSVTGIKKVQELRKSGIETQGALVDWNRYELNVEDLLFSKARYLRPIIIFVANDGKSYTFTSIAQEQRSEVSRGSSRYQIMPITVLYLPDSPTTAELAYEIQTDTEAYLSHKIGLATAIATSVLSILFLFAAIRLYYLDKKH